MDVTDSEFAANAAFGGSISALGGAFQFFNGISGRLVRVTLRGNVAHSSALVSGGAANLVASTMTLHECNVMENSASRATERAQGGAFALETSPSRLDIISSQLIDNEVMALGAVSALGGAVFASAGQSEVTVVGSGLIGNHALAFGALAAGGSIYVGEQTSISVAYTPIIRSRARGGSGEGGAVWCAAASFSMKNTSLAGGTASAYGMDGGHALGGAVFVAGLQAHFVDCSLVGSSAIMETGLVSAKRASGGALHVGASSRAELERCRLLENSAGGRGGYNFYAPKGYAEQLSSSAKHIYSLGKLLLKGCELMDDPSYAGVSSPVWWWIVSAAGTVVLQYSTFASSKLVTYDPCQVAANNGLCQGQDLRICPDGGDYTDCGIDPGRGTPAKFLNVIGSTDVLVDGCSFSNLIMESTGSILGVVDSTFDPPLDSSVLPTVQPPECGVKRVGEAVCDPRALCEQLTSGGVRCSCVGDGLETKNGTLPNGRQCQQQTKIKLLTQTNLVTLSVKKPSFRTDAVAVIFSASGETSFRASYSRRTLLRRDSRAIAQSDDGLHARVFGLAFEWRDPQPASVETMSLDAAKQRYSNAIEHTFTLSLQCALEAFGSSVGNSTACPQDGDTIETTIYVTPQAGNGMSTVPSEIRILAEVQSVVSCERTKPTVRVMAGTELGGIRPSSPLSVHLLAMDMDDQPIRFSRAELELTWDKSAVPFDWLRGEYSWNIPPDREPGDHEIVVSLKGANCTLLRRTVIVTSGDVCAVGKFFDLVTKNCKECEAGYSSSGGTASSCTACAPGTTSR